MEKIHRKTEFMNQPSICIKSAIFFKYELVIRVFYCLTKMTLLTKQADMNSKINDSILSLSVRFGNASVELDLTVIHNVQCGI